MSMHAIMMVPQDGGAQFAWLQVPRPSATAGTVLVRIYAAAVNRGEIIAARAVEQGAPRPSGIEFAGEIVEVGQGVSGYTLGDRVMGHSRGGQAEYIAVDPRYLMPLPTHLSWIEGGAWPNVFITAHDAMVTNARLQAGESVLVTAASSGVGVAALQIARWLGAKPVLGTSGSSAKLAQLQEWGLDVGIDTSKDRWTTDVLEATAEQGADVVIDNVGGTMLAGLLQCMRLQGRFISVGRLATTTAPLDLDLLARKRLALIGVTFRTRTPEEHLVCVQACARDLLPALQAGRLRPVVDRVFPAAQITAAHAYMLSNSHIGKIVLEF